MVSRSAAERHLRAILTSGQRDAEPAPRMSWSLTEEEPARPDPESHLEQRFRAVFRERVTQLGATVKESPGPRGNRLTVTFPGHGRTWTLEPQVLMGSSKPDFVLTSSQGGLPPVAIFTDGRGYHATQARNRIADDAAKRQDLRDGGAIVLGITAQDIAAAQAGIPQPPPWLRDDTIAELMQESPGFSRDHVDAIRRGPFQFLLAWLQNPDVAGYRALAGQVPFLFVPDGTHLSLPDDADLVTQAGRLLQDAAGSLPGTDTGSPAWWWSAGPVGCLTRYSGGMLEVALVLDDRDDALAEPGHADAWREWLRISNALNLRQQPTRITALSAVTADGHRRQPATAPAGGPVGRAGSADPGAGVPADWADLRARTIPGPERQLLDELIRLRTVPLPEIGLEAADGIPIDFAWPGLRIAVCLDLPEYDRRVLESDGWRLLPADPRAIADALNGAA